MLLQPDTLAAAVAPPPPVPPPDTAAVDSLAETVAETVSQAVPALAQAKAAADRIENAVTIPAVDVPRPEVAPAVASAWDRVVGAVHDVTGLGTLVASNLLLTLLTVAVLWGARQLALAVVRARRPEPRAVYSWRKGTGYVAVGLGVLLVGRIWLGALGGFGTFLGLLTAGVAIALRDPLVNLAGWVFILWKRPFAPGDRVTVRTHTGDVIDQRLFQFTLMEVGTPTGAAQSTGRIIHVPNGWVFSDSVVNFSGVFAYVWHEIAVTVTFESHWRDAKALLDEIVHAQADTLSPDAERTLRRAAREYFIFYSKLTPVVYTRVVDHGVELTMRYLVPPRHIRGSEEGIWEAVLDAFAARDDIAFAYPTSRIFRTPTEGKPGAGGRPELDPRSDDPIER